MIQTSSIVISGSWFGALQMVTRTNPLYSVWGKLAWAERHIAAFRKLEESIRLEMTIGHYFEFGSEEHVFYMSGDVESLFQNIQSSSLILGDIVHNLRSALGHLA